MRLLLVLALVGCATVSAYQSYAKEGVLAGDEPFTQAQLADIANRKATCPFIGSIVNQGLLAVGQTADKPLAQVSGVVALGNTGAGSTLGYVLKLFATGNHARQLGASGRLDQPVPANWFSLDFPGSQGSHWGHSGILQGNPTQLNTGRWSQADFDRLTAKASGGVLTTKAVGEFIGENIARDPKSRTVTSGGLLSVLLPDSVKLLGSIGTAALNVFRSPASATPQAWRQVTIGITKLLGDDNLIGSAGEFGLLLAFLENSPNSKGGFSVAEVTSMFARHQLPAGWNSWKKSALSWVKYTSELTYHARHRYNQITNK